MKKILIAILAALGVSGWIMTAFLAHEVNKEVDENIENYNDASRFSMFIRIHEDEVRQNHRMFGLTDYEEETVRKANSKKFAPWKYRD